jgi:DNA-binding CsgD family transcriptional regulator
MLGSFLAYHIISIVIGGAAISSVFILYLKSKNAGLLPFLLANLLLLLFVAGLSYELYCELIGLKISLSRKVVHEAEQFICLGLCVLLPRVGRPPILGGFSERVEGAFAIASGLIALAFGAYFLFPFGATVYLGLYALIYVDLVLAIAYFALTAIIFRRRSPPSTAMRHYNSALTILRGLTIACLPALFVVDFFGWMIPALKALIPKDLSLLPAFYVVMSLIMVVGSINEILEPPPPERIPFDETLLRRFDLSKREAEILPLALEFLSYKEIGERLFISVGTVRTHLIHIYQKTGARNRLDLLRIVHRGIPSREITV